MPTPGETKLIGVPEVGSVTPEVASRFISIEIVDVTTGVSPAVGICSAVAVPGMMVPVASAG